MTDLDKLKRLLADYDTAHSIVRHEIRIAVFNALPELIAEIEGQREAWQGALKSWEGFEKQRQELAMAHATIELQRERINADAERVGSLERLQTSFILNNNATYEHIARLESAIGSLFDKIAHGDDDHRAWLKEAITSHFRRPG